MFLALDIGNTNLTWGAFDGERLRASGKIPTDADRPAEGFARELRAALAAAAIDRSTVTAGMVGSVVRGMAAKARDAIRVLSGAGLREARADMDLGIGFAVEDPGRVGIDRLLAAAAAFVAGGPVVVADLGTALTVDLVSGDGIFMGGTIAPGLRLCLGALHGKTSLLPRVDLSPPAAVVGTNTPDCIRSGVVHGVAGMVDGLVRRVSEGASGPVRAILTGGDAAFLSPYLTIPHELDPHLVLRGLLLAHRRNPGT
jgi:type III pantothenate kinase